MKFDILIVGGGIAGCCAAWFALKRDQKVLWLDQSKKNISSSVAAGMVNPIVLRRFTKSWNADTLLPYARNFYNEIDQNLDCKTYHEVPIYRVFASEDERNLWCKKMTQENFDQYMEIPKSSPNEKNIIDDFGYGAIKGGGYLDVNRFMKKIKHYFTESGGVYKEEEFDHRRIDPVLSKYNNVQFKNILFCEGQHMHANPYFNDLPYRRTKGEVLRFKTLDIQLKKGIFSRGIFCLPLKNNEYKIGATFTHDDFSVEGTSNGLKELKTKLNKLFNGSYKVTQHYAGIRPTVKDRRPLLGQHPERYNFYIFNGLGTKGVLLAPYFANVIINRILDAKSIPKSVDITRFYTDDKKTKKTT